MHNPERLQLLDVADRKVCGVARNRMVDAFPEMTKSAYRLVCYALDPDRRTGQGTVREYAKLIGAHPSTIMSTWHRAALKLNLPTVQFTAKAVLLDLAFVRLRAALETNASNAEVAGFLGWSSSQSICRAIRAECALTVREWCRTSTAAGEFEKFLRRMIPFAKGFAMLHDTRRALTLASSFDHAQQRRVAEGGK